MSRFENHPAPEERFQARRRRRVLPCSFTSTLRGTLSYRQKAFQFSFFGRPDTLAHFILPSVPERNFQYQATEAPKHRKTRLGRLVGRLRQIWDGLVGRTDLPT